MKKIAIAILLIISAYLLNAQFKKLDGYKLGDKIYSTSIQTKIAGIEGCIVFRTLDNKTIYKMEFIPTKSGVHANLSNEDCNTLISYFKNRYQITSGRLREGNKFFICRSGKIKYHISVEREFYRSSKNKFHFYMEDRDLAHRKKCVQRIRDEPK